MAIPAGVPVLLRLGGAGDEHEPGWTVVSSRLSYFKERFYTLKHEDGRVEDSVPYYYVRRFKGARRTK